ncbi:MAG: 3-hydroxybutyryl-CoA dehydrogenase [Myxococcales bacterium]|nr:MAG: 3-hydroxybutyryl-CoA dehydrogenase [Myxococcales bacterium]
MDIKVVGVLGAGQMGRGIAQVTAQAGCNVLLLDVDLAHAKQGHERIGKDLLRLVDKGKMQSAERQTILQRITPNQDLKVLSEADLVIEAATEQQVIKEKLLSDADKVMKPEALLASNTSSISLTKLAAVTSRPDKVIGMHFMNPVPVMKLVEIIPAIQSSEECVQTIKQFAARLGKMVVTSKDSPGFLVNRMLMPFINEACFALQEGLSSPEEIDEGVRLGLNHPMGPLELADFVGLDTVLYIAEVLHRELGDDKYRPATILRNYVAAGWLGRKAGRGFYNYTEK